jgi:DNA-binding NarL/FixJ family response regulator
LLKRFVLVMSGVDTLVAIRTETPEAKIVMLTTFEGHADAQRALEAGAYAYLLKTMPPRDLANAIRRFHAGEKQPG